MNRDVAVRLAWGAWTAWMAASVPFEFYYAASAALGADYVEAGLWLGGLLGGVFWVREIWHQRLRPVVERLR